MADLSAMLSQLGRRGDVCECLCARGCVCAKVFMYVYGLKRKEIRERIQVLCMLLGGGRQSVPEDGWEHQALGSRNVRQTDIKDI